MLMYVGKRKRREGWLDKEIASNEAMSKYITKDESKRSMTRMYHSIAMIA